MTKLDIGRIFPTACTLSCIAGSIGTGVIPTIYSAVIYKNLHSENEENIG